MTLRELLQSVDAEAYASVPLFEELLNTKPEYGSGNRIEVKLVNGEIAVSRSTFGRFACKERSCGFVGRHRGLSHRCGTRPSRKTLTEQETDILCAYYGLQTKRLTVRKIAEKHLLSESRVMKIVRESERKLQFSDDAIEIWKYLYRR